MKLTLVLCALACWVVLAYGGDCYSGIGYSDQHFINVSNLVFYNDHRTTDVIFIYDPSPSLQYNSHIFPSRKVTQLPNGFIKFFGFVQYDFICEVSGCTGSYDGSQGYTLNYYDYGYLVVQNGTAIVKRCVCGKITSENPCRSEDRITPSVSAACHMIETASYD